MMMSSPNVLIIGQGAIGLPVTNQLADQGIQVTGLARGARADYQLHPNADFIQADARQLSAEQLTNFSHIAIIVTPNHYNAEDYKNTYLKIVQHLCDLADQLPKLGRVVFISSTGVYGQNQGEWIDDSITPKRPKREASTYILEAEQALQHTFGERAVIIRPSGIYGKNRLMRVQKAQENDKPAMPECAWTNRIMDTDLINIIVQVLIMSESSKLKRIYLATDYAPVRSYELMCWLANQLGSTLPPCEQSAISGKRLHSNIPRDWLQYPDWVAGYSYILNSLSK